MIARTKREDDAPDLGRLIDRLVDGELSDDARRALLLRLDSEPSGAGWRRCALAFLESRDWRDALLGRAVADDGCGTAASTPDPATPRVAPISIGFPGRPARWLGLAASLVLAFAAGRAGRPAAEGPMPAGPLTAEAVGHDLVPSERAEALAAMPELDDDSWLGLDGRSSPSARSGGDPAWRPSPSSTVRAEGGPWAWSDTPDPATPPALPATVIDDWRRRGFEVETRPRVVSVGRDDGRPVSVPVNEVRVRYVGDRTY